MCLISSLHWGESGLPAIESDAKYDSQYEIHWRLSLTSNKTAETSRSSLMVVAVWVGAIASAGGLVAMLLTAIEKINAGHGLDTYRTKWLVEDNWIGFLTFFAVTTVVVAVAALIGWFQRRKEQREVEQLQAKYSDHSD